MAMATAKSSSSVRARIRRPLWTSGWLLILALVVAGFGLVASRPAVRANPGPLAEDPATALRAIAAILSPGSSPSSLPRLPPDFAEVTGVTAAELPARDGTIRAVHLDGGCSAPWGDDNTRWDFAVPCKTHDLGYDLLRYADQKGQPLGADVRKALDDRLSADMHETCQLNPMNSAGSCHLVASLYTAGLVVNSWHQRWGTPTGEPIGPMLAGVLVAGGLLAVRLRGWLRNRKTLLAGEATEAGKTSNAGKIGKAGKAREAGEAGDTGDTVIPADAPAPIPPVTPWAALGVASIVVLVIGESALALAGWAGLNSGWSGPLTWLVQLAPLFFFAGGRANIAGWRAEVAAGGGYRQYLAHRASWVLRPTLIFVVVALVVPLALELLRIPNSTNSVVVRLALHPLWIIGMYVLTVAVAPVMLALHARAAKTTLGALVGIVVAAELLARWLDSSIPHHVAAFGLAVLAQQLAFWQVDRGFQRVWLALGAATAAAGLLVTSLVRGTPPIMLGVTGAPPTFSAHAWPILLLGLAQICLLGLVSAPLSKLHGVPALGRAVRGALRAPMSLYLGFLAAVLLVLPLVSLRGQLGDVVAWLFRPAPLTGLALLIVPAAAVFWWFERRQPTHPPIDHGARQPGGRFATVLGYGATVLGVYYAVIGVFGFALTQFGGSTTTVLGLQTDPIQNLVQLLLGVFLLHSVRVRTSAATSTWLMTAIACVPPLLDALHPGHLDGLNGMALVVHGATAIFALAGVIGTLRTVRTKPQTAEVAAETG